MKLEFSREAVSSGVANAVGGLFSGASIAYTAEILKTAMKVNIISAAIAGAVFNGVFNFLDRVIVMNRGDDGIKRFIIMSLAGAAALHMYAVSLNLSQNVNYAIIGATVVLALVNRG